MSENLINTSEKTAQLVNERLKIDFQYYKQTLSFLGANAPLGVLCLGTYIERILRKQGINRVYDLIPFREDFSKIEGLGKSSIDRLTARFDEFFSIYF